MSAFEILIYVGMAGTVAQVAWHVAVLIVLVVIARQLWRRT